MSTPQKQRVRRHRSSPAPVDESPAPAPAPAPITETPPETPQTNILEEILWRVNDIRINLGIPKLKVEKKFKNFTPDLIQGVVPNSPSSVMLTWLSFVEEWDPSMTSEEMITKWMADPSRRPVLLSPGDKVWLDFGEKDGTDVILFIVLSIFH